MGKYNRRRRLREDNFDVVPDIIIPELEVPVEEVDFAETSEDSGITTTILSLITEANNSVQSYISFKETLKSISHQEDKYFDYFNIIDNIIKDELNHVGMLQALLKQTSPHAQSIETGEIEANQMIDDNYDIEGDFLMLGRNELDESLFESYFPLTDEELKEEVRDLVRTDIESFVDNIANTVQRYEYLYDTRWYDKNGQYQDEEQYLIEQLVDIIMKRLFADFDVNESVRKRLKRNLKQESMKKRTRNRRKIRESKRNLTSKRKSLRLKEDYQYIDDIDKSVLIDAMEAAGYDYDDLESYDEWVHFFGHGGSIAFDSWDELREWLEYVEFDDPDVTREVERILHPERYDESCKKRSSDKLKESSKDVASRIRKGNLRHGNFLADNQYDEEDVYNADRYAPLSGFEWDEDDDVSIQIQDRESNLYAPHEKHPRTKSYSWGRIWKNGDKIAKEFEGQKYAVRQDMAKYLDSMSESKRRKLNKLSLHERVKKSEDENDLFTQVNNELSPTKGFIIKEQSKFPGISKSKRYDIDELGISYNGDICNVDVYAKTKDKLNFAYQIADAYGLKTKGPKFNGNYFVLSIIMPESLEL